MSVKDNILLPLVFKKTYYENDEEIGDEENLVSTNRKRSTLRNFSGQKQRVAARAIITDPEILSCGRANRSPDSKSSAALLDVFDEINERGQTSPTQQQLLAGPSVLSTKT